MTTKKSLYQCKDKVLCLLKDILKKFKLIYENILGYNLEKTQKDRNQQRNPPKE